MFSVSCFRTSKAHEKFEDNFNETLNVLTKA